MLSILRASLRTGRVTRDHSDPAEAGACRGRPQLDPARCDGAAACASVCPSGAITLTQAASGTRRWQLDLARCVFCGLCQEVCPHRAITMTNQHELAARSRDDLIVGVAISAQGAEPSGGRKESDGIVVPLASPACPERAVAPGALLTARIRGLLKRSLHIRHMAAGSDNSCDWEIAHLLNPVYDIQRLGIDFVASPRHADLLMVTGAVTRNLKPALYATYEAMPSPRLVAAVGSEACGGGVLQGAYAVAGGVDRCLPVDVYIPGDPPHPRALIQGLLIALQRLEPKPINRGL
ncbi:MAG: 4Fe-4S dicluster domain-containing protein [Dehalococcoidia bacterium]|nr:4Fe-4S dicluster domain-containing protein [Dehalococcoidia bacterium]